MKKHLLSLLLISQSVLFLSSCDGNQNIYEKLENNVMWFDKDRNIEFAIQGQWKTGLGFGTIKLKNGIKVEGDFRFSSPRCDILDFLPLNDKYLTRDLSFNVKHSNINGDSKLGLSLVAATDPNKQLSFGWSTVYIEKRKLSEAELDAKYFHKRKWQNEEGNFSFSKINSINSKTMYYPYDGVFYDATFSFSFLEKKRFFIKFSTGEEVIGSYLSCFDYSMTLVIEEGDRLTYLGNTIKLI